MRITLSVLLAVLTIYCSSTVLSLPPSLIAKAASLRQPRLKAAAQLQEENAAAAPSPYGQNGLWKKDAEFLLGRNGMTTERAGNALDDIANQQRNLATANDQQHKADVVAASANAARAAQQRNSELSRKLAAEYDLNALLATAAGAADLQARQRQRPQHQIAPQTNEFFTPLKYWARHCQPGSDCPQEYYRVLLADRSRQQQQATAARPLDEFAAAPAAVLRFVDNGGGGVGVGDAATAADDAFDGDDVVGTDAIALALSGDGRFNNARLDDLRVTTGGSGAAAEADDDNVNVNDDDTADNDILMLLNGEQDVMKFLSWAMEQLYPYRRIANVSGGSNDAADSNHPAMYIWKKLNMSGRLEPPLIVEEPHYIIVRREQLEEDLQSGSKNNDDPFIPPRGRKHNMPNLDALLNRYETFVPNRGRRDKIKDLFKYDDLFFPNRGKKQKPPKATTLAAFNRDCDGGGDGNNSDSIAGDGADAAEGKQHNQLIGNELGRLASPPATVAMRRFWGQLHQRLRPRKRCLQALPSNRNSQAANEVSYDNSNNSDDDNNDGINNQSGNDNDYDNSNSGEWSPHGRVPSYKPNEDDQSVKASMPAIPAITTTTTTAKSPAIATPTAALQQRWRTEFANTRLRRVAGSFAGAARVAANRFHSTSATAPQRQRQQQQQHYQQEQQQQQQQRQQQRQHQHHRQQQQQQQQRHYWRQKRREHLQLQLQHQPTQQQQQQQYVAAWPALSLPHQLKSYDDLDLLLWRQLQLPQQKPLTWRHPQLSAPQHLPPQQRHSEEQQQQLGWQQAQPQLRPQSQETQLANAAVAADDIDYLYVNI